MCFIKTLLGVKKKSFKHEFAGKISRPWISYITRDINVQLKPSVYVKKQIKYRPKCRKISPSILRVFTP